MTRGAISNSTNRAAFITVYGEVKSVGFRRLIWRLAKTLDLKGYVENVPGEDCVKVYVEGHAERLEEFLSRISAASKIYGITKVEVRERACTSNYSDFIIVGCAGEVI